MSNFFNASNDSRRVFGIGIEDPLFNAVLTRMPKLPGFDFVIVGFLFTKHEQHERLRNELINFRN